MDSVSVTPATGGALEELRGHPYALLAELDQRLVATAVDSGVAAPGRTWVGLGFRLGSQWFLAPQQDVREVILPPSQTRVPNARPWLLGVANVRGNLLPLVDLSRLLGGPAGVIGRESRFLVLNSDDVPAGFLVDAVSGYRRFTPEDQKHELVTTQNDDSRPFLLGGFMREEQNWLVFSLQKLVRSELFRNASG